MEKFARTRFTEFVGLVVVGLAQESRKFDLAVPKFGKAMPVQEEIPVPTPMVDKKRAW